MLLAIAYDFQCFLNKVSTYTRLLFISALVMLSYTAIASTISLESALKFKTLSTQDGLSQSYVFSIAQDKQGFIWIATEDGLNRYDGQAFTHYRHNDNKPHSIADNFIRKVFVDKQGTLWIGTNNGLSRYNPELDNFNNYYNETTNINSLSDNVIWDIYQDKKNTLWVTTANGMHRYLPQSDSFEPVTIKQSPTKLRDIKTLFQDKNNNYWIGTYDQGVFIANEKLTYLQSLQHKNKWQLTIPATSLFDIKEIDGNYWLATNQGVYVVNPNYKVIQHLTTASTNQQLLSDEIRTIEALDDSNVWLGSRNGLNTINLFTEEIKAYQSSANPNDKSLSQNWVHTIFKDKDERMWLGNLGTGIDIYNPITSLFQHKLFNRSISIDSIAETNDGKIWFASESLKLGYFIPNKTNSLKDKKIETKTSVNFLKSSQNNLWLLTFSNELYRLNSANMELTHYPIWTEQVNLDVNYSFIVNKEVIWFINKQGALSAFNTVSQNIQHFNTLIPNEKLQTLQIDKANKIWLVSNQNRLYQFDINSNTFTELIIEKNIDFSLNDVSNITVTYDYLWLSSYNQGALLVNKKNLSTYLFNEHNGLINNNINAILIDMNKNAWVSAANGISVIHPKTKQVKSFSQDYGLNDNELLRSSALVSSQGIIYFGGLNGFIQFNPNDIVTIKQNIPTPVLKQLLIANKPVSINAKAIKKEFTTNNQENDKFAISKHINQLDKLTLAYTQSPFSIEFTTPNPKLPSQIAYRYRLLDLEQNWLDTGRNNQRATYTNLSAGDYTFEVQVYDRYNPTQVKTKRLAIEILPPWWLSQYALLAYCLFILLVIAYFIQQIRHRRLIHLQVQQSEERLKLSLWGSGDEMWDWNINTGKIYRSNIWGVLEFPQDGCRNLSDAQKDALNNPQLSENEKLLLLREYSNIHPQDIYRVYQAIEDHKQGKSDHFEATYRVKSTNNQWLWVLDRGKAVEYNEHNIPTRITGTLKDISHIKNAEEQLKLFAKCIESISDAVVIFNRQFRIVNVNSAYQKITGESKEQVLNKPLFFSRYPDDFTLSVKRHVLTHGNWHGEIENIRNNKELYYIDLNIDIIRDDDNNISHFVGVFSDISERKANEAELRKLANSDTLTGLPNRSFFQATQTRLVEHKIPHALLVFDLDHFKKINDSLGHEVGDLLLCQVAKRIVNTARAHDTVYRLGGDEFGLIIENTNDIHTITSIAKKILSKIAEPLKLKSQELVLHSSIGIVLYPEDGSSPQELLKNADTAMYHAKGSGGNKYQFFNESMNKQAVKRLQIENLIRFGLKNDYFSVHYQPKIEIATGKIAGMEALVRFQTPSKGIISPAVFIPVSEETGQIIDIGEIVLRKACLATKKWVEAGLFDGRIAVNLSAVQFTQPNLVAVISDILKETQLPARYLELEITEGTVMDSPQSAINTMLQIRSMGIHLSLDDFGTGYSSLAYLKRFPLNTLKIDKAFVDDIEESEQGRNMVATIVTIAHNLGLQVVAEGVEQTLQLDFLASLDCEQLQGYLYSKPLAEKDFYQYLLAHKITHKSTHFNKD